MFGLRDLDTQLPAPVRVGPGGLAPVAILAAVFAGLAAKVGFPVGMAALVGGIGGTASLLVHELAHVAAARRSAGIRSSDVSLVWMGAATRLEGKYETGRDQIRVAIAGPRASFALAMGLFGECFFMPMPVHVKQAVILLAIFNMAITVLNVVPVYPLDGYKLVLGLLWSWTGSESKARRILRRIGVAWALIELPSTALLVVMKPPLGIVVVIVGLSFFAQRRFARRSARIAPR